MHALHMLKTEGRKAADMGLVLAFEYDAKSPGMWQVATQHLDMDIGWVHESQPLEIASLRQVKVVAGVSGVRDAMHASLEKGQLSLEGPERRLVIYCPSASVADFATGEWKLEIARRLVKCQALLAKPKQAVLS